MAVRTGLEPATSCVTGRHSNQLNYQTIKLTSEKANYSSDFELVTRPFRHKRDILTS